MSFSFKDFLKGKKTYLVVLALMALNTISANGDINLDLPTLKENLLLALGATFRAAIAQVEAALGGVVGE